MIVARLLEHRAALGRAIDNAAGAAGAGALLAAVAGRPTWFLTFAALVIALELLHPDGDE